MNTNERPGLSEKWLKNVKVAGKHKSTFRGDLVAANVADLEYFLTHGRSEGHLSMQRITGFVPEPTIPAQRGWEAHLPLELNFYGGARLCEWEVVGINEGIWDAQLADAAFEAVRVSQLISLNSHRLFPQRHGGSVLRTMQVRFLAYTTLGLVNGREEAALALAQMQLAALRLGYYDADLLYPASCFAARVLADHMGQPPLIIKSDPAHFQKHEIPADVVMDGLFKVWRDADVHALQTHLLAVCDIHTHHAFSGANSFRREFGSGMWSRVPIVALLVFKLRALRGLANPEVDHPLLSTALGTLPAAAPRVPDPLLERVLARMRQDGFDEAEIAEHYARQVLDGAS